MAISKSVALDVRRYLEAAEIPLRPGMKLGWFHLGADMDQIKDALPLAMTLMFRLTTRFS